MQLGIGQLAPQRQINFCLILCGFGNSLLVLLEGWRSAQHQVKGYESQTQKLFYIHLYSIFFTQNNSFKENRRTL